MRTLSFLLALLLFAASAGAQIYRWVDEKGTVHFSQSPPPAAPQGAAVDVIPEERRSPMVTGGPPPPEEQEEKEATRVRERPAPVEDDGGEEEYGEGDQPVGESYDDGGDLIIVEPPVDWDRLQERREQIREGIGPGESGIGGGITRPPVGAVPRGGRGRR